MVNRQKQHEIGDREHNPEQQDTVLQLREKIRSFALNTLKPSELWVIESYLKQFSCAMQVSACQEPEDFRTLFWLHGIHAEQWRNSKWMVRNHSGLLMAIYRDTRFSEVGWGGFKDFMGPPEEPVITEKIKLPIDVTILSHPKSKQVASCETPEDFRTLFDLHDIPAVENGCNSQWMREHGHQTLYQAIVKDSRFGQWKLFQGLMSGDAHETKLPIDVTILSHPKSKQVASCETPEDFRTLFDLHDIPAVENGCNSQWMREHGHQTLYQAIVKDSRFLIANGGWKIFRAFMQISPTQRHFATREYLVAFEDAAGKKYEEMRVTDTTIVEVPTVDIERTPKSLFQAVSRGILGENIATAGRALCIHIRDGKTPEEAKNLVNESRMITDMTPEYLLSFENGAQQKLENISPADDSPVTFNVGAVEKKRAPAYLFCAVASKLLGREHRAAAAAGRDLCMYIRDGKTPEEAVSLFMQKEKNSAISREYLLAFEEAMEKKLEDMELRDTSIVQFTVNQTRIEESPARLFQRIARQFVGEKNSTKVCKELCIHIRDGKTIEEARKLVNFNEEERVDKEFAELDKLGLAEMISVLGQEDPQKLKLYLQFSHPELSEEDVNRLVIRSFKGLTSGSTTKEQEFLRFTEEIPPIKIHLYTYAEERGVVVMEGSTSAPIVCISGCWNRRVSTEQGTFRIEIPLKPQTENEIRIMGVDPAEQKRTKQEWYQQHHEGQADDIEALVMLLDGLKGTLHNKIRSDSGCKEYFAQCMEKVLIRKFARSFVDGETYTQKLIEKTNSRVMHLVLENVLSHFRKIDKMQFPNVQPGSLMFFQKYCAAEIRRRKGANDPGVILANDPGLGKTRTVLASIADEEAGIFCPNSVVSTWDEEATTVLSHSDILVMHNIPLSKRKDLLRGRRKLRYVTNVQFLQKPRDVERFDLLSHDNMTIVHDEAHGRVNEQSQQSTGARMLKHKFQINVTATPAKNPDTVRRILRTLLPHDERFSSRHAFQRAFPPDDSHALKTLSLLLGKYAIRFRKTDVMEEVDPSRSLRQQTHRLPKKEFIDSNDIGRFEMGIDQAEAIYQMFLNWDAWSRKYNKYIPEDEVAEEDRLRVAGALTKRHALRQTVNNPSYIGSKEADAKAAQVERIVEKSIQEGRKVVLFCAYNAQTLKYAEIFRGFNPSVYTGLTSKIGEKKGSNGIPMCFARDDETGGWAFDASGYPLEDPNGETMPALDYERLAFQNADDRKLIICTYQTGAVGTTFTAGKHYRPKKL